MAKRGLTFRAVVLGILCWLFIAFLFGVGFSLLVFAARAISDEPLVRAVVVIIGGPFVLYAIAVVSAPVTGIKVPPLGTYLLSLLRPGRKSKSPNRTVEADARKDRARGSL